MSAPFTHTPGRSSAARTIVRRFAWTISLVVVLLLVALVAGRIWLRHAMQAALPQIDGNLVVRGLQHPVRVERDEHGVPHIIAQTEDDLVFAQGFVTAQDRLWQMDILRRHPAGELAEILGSKFIQHDKMQRTLQVRAAAEGSIAAMDARERHWLQQYSDGVNAFLDANENHLPAEFRFLRYTPRRWSPRDSMLVAFAMAQDLSTSYPNKLNREAVAAKLDPASQADLYPVGSWRDHPPAEGKPDLTEPTPFEEIPLDESQASLRAPQHTTDLLAAQHEIERYVSRFQCDQCSAGSNNWVVSGAHTVSGHPLLSNDMHLALGVPGIWYEANLEAGDFHVTGVTLPGVPFVIVGHNQHIAWGFTNSMADAQDLYIENVANDKFQTPDGVWRPIEHRHETIVVKRGKSIDWDVALTEHNKIKTPIVTPLYPNEKRELALIWQIYDSANISDPFEKVNRAANWNDFQAAFSTFSGPAQNAVYADDGGNIGYHLVGKLPIRGTSGVSPVPVPAGQYEWTGYIPFAQLPNVFDPPSGILATANSRVTAESTTYPIALDWLAPYRNERIWKVLGADKKFTPEDMLKLQNDVYSDLDKTMANRIVYAVDHAPKASKRAKQAADILRTWDGNVNMLSSAPSIVAATRAAFTALLLEPKLGDTAKLYTWGERSFALEQIISNQPERWLPKQFSDWSAFITAALEQGMKDASAPADLQNWKWGRVNKVEISHPIFGSSPLIDRLLSVHTGTGAWPVPGNAYTVRPGLPKNGASERFTADPTAPDQATLNIVTGQSANPLSPWYLDQFGAWLDGTTLPLPYTSQKTAHTLVLTPQ